MYNIWSFSGLGAVVCSGLGGGSLIYANVLIRKPEMWFVKENLNGGGFEYWQVTRADVDSHYDQVEKMLGAQQYPIDEKPYNGVPKAFSRGDLWPQWMPALGPEPRPRPGPEAVVGPPVDTPPVPLRVARDRQDRRGEGRAKG